MIYYPRAALRGYTSFVKMWHTVAKPLRRLYPLALASFVIPRALLKGSPLSEVVAKIKKFTIIIAIVIF